MENNLILSEVSANLKMDNQILTNIKNNINQTFKKNLYYNVVWHSFHSFSVNYVPPTTPTQIYKTDIYYFMNNIKKSVTSCNSCSTDDSYYIINNMEEIISSNQKMVEWFVKLHNKINFKKNGNNDIGTFKTGWTAQEVIDKYTTNTNYKNILSTNYNINMDILSNTNTLSTFYTELNRIKTTINSNKTEYTDYTFNTILK